MATRHDIGPGGRKRPPGGPGSKRPSRGGEDSASSRARGRPGGEESRRRILAEAGRLFARDGFDAVSVRTLADRAKVNLAAIGYHFGGKKGLYHHVLRQLIDDLKPITEPAIARLEAGVAAAHGRPELLAGIVAAFVGNTLAAFLLNDTLRWQHNLLVREFSQPSGEFAMLMNELVHPLHDAVAKLVAAAVGGEAGSTAVRLLTTNVVGQCMIYGVVRTLVWARVGWDAYTPDNVAEIAAMVTRSVQRSLCLPEVPGPVQGSAR